MRGVLTAALLIAASSTRAADMAIGSFDGPNPIISISGPIEVGDDHKFVEFAQALKIPAIVRLQSTGGSTFAALAIGREIAQLGFTTYVGKDGLCASACGLIWLAGKPRVGASTARIGLHATYIKQGDSSVETSPGNALVGKYLGELGFRDEFVVYATSSPPQEMAWLNRSVTDLFGVDWQMRDDDMATLVTAITSPAVLPPQPVQGATPALVPAPLSGTPVPLVGSESTAPDFMPPMAGFPQDQRPPLPPKPKPKPAVPSVARVQPGLVDALGDLFFGHSSAR